MRKEKSLKKSQKSCFSNPIYKEESKVRRSREVRVSSLSVLYPHGSALLKRLDLGIGCSLNLEQYFPYIRIESLNWHFY